MTAHDPHAALHSLYGKGGAAGPGAARVQEILTPQGIWDALDELWPEGVQLDPCHAPGSLGRAQHTYRVAGIPVAKGDKIVMHYFAQPGELNGLALPWAPRTYVNPPFGRLESWLDKAQREPAEQCVLCPVRLKRAWFRKAWINATQRIALDGVKFVGYANDFPESLCILYRGSRDAAWAFRDLGQEV